MQQKREDKNLKIEY